MTNKLTPAQRGAMHLYFEHLANALNDAGLDMVKVLKPGIDIPWTKQSVKDHLYKPVLEAMTGKESTEDMTTVDPEAVYKVLNRHTADKLGISLEWPSKESQYNESQGIK